MKKTLLLAGLIIAGCNSDPLQTIKDSKIKGRDLTWGQAAEQFKYCTPDSKHWSLKEQGKGRDIAIFSCTVNDEVLKALNERFEQEAKKVFNQENQLTNRRLSDYVKYRDDYRKRFIDGYTAQCKDCTILEGMNNKDIDALALEYYKNRDTKNPVIQELKNKQVTLDTAFFNLGDTLNKIAQVKEAVPSNFNAVQSGEYTLEIRHWTDEKEKQHRSEFSASEEINLILADQKKDRGLNPLNADYIIDNKNPAEMIPKSYSAGSIFQ